MNANNCVSLPKESVTREAHDTVFILLFILKYNLKPHYNRF